jgi:hypothetical protein
LLHNGSYMDYYIRSELYSLLVESINY